MNKLNMLACTSLCALLCALTGNAALADDVSSRAPEQASGYAEKAGWTAKKFMVAAANPLAVDAGYLMLKQGGAAIDAAIATQMVLGLVEPQSSGIGGGAFIMHFDGQQIEAYDGRETAPAAATERLFQDANGKPVSYATGVVGGRSVGVPGCAADAGVGASPAWKAAVGCVVRAGDQTGR